MKNNDSLLLVTTREAARLLSISPRTLWTLTNTSTIPSIRLNSCVRYSLDDLRAWIKNNKKGGQDR